MHSMGSAETEREKFARMRPSSRGIFRLGDCFGENLTMLIRPAGSLARERFLQLPKSALLKICPGGIVDEAGDVEHLQDAGIHGGFGPDVELLFEHDEEYAVLAICARQDGVAVARAPAPGAEVADVPLERSCLH